MLGHLEDYEVLNVIGTGSFGTCYKVKKKCDGSLYVWKAVSYGGMTEDKKQLLVSEVNLLSELRHQNIVQYHDRIIHKETAMLYIVMEWCEGGDLATLIKKSKKGGSFLDEGFIWRVLYQMSRALQACHWHLSKVTVLHRDIKPANVFLDGVGNVKLGDFGLARILHNDASFAQTLVGTPYYMSPEVIKGGKYNKKSDIWSLGCLIYELCSLSPPFTGPNIKHLAVNIKEGKFSRIPAHYSDDLQKIISLLLSVEHNFRPTIEMILHHPTVVSHIAQETLKAMFVNPIDESKRVHTDCKEEEIRDTTNAIQNLHNLHLSSAFQNEKGSEDCSNEKVRDVWLNRFHILKQREANLRVKEVAADERERAIAKKEKQVALLDRITKEKMTRADVYLRQCREVRSVASSVKNLQQQRCSTVHADLDTSLSADPGDTSMLPTSTKLNPECVTKPSPFMRVGSERRVHFDTLPITRSKAKQYDLEYTPKQYVSQPIRQNEELYEPLRTNNKELHGIKEHILSKVNKIPNRKEERQERRVKNPFRDLERPEEDNFRNDVLAVLNTNQYTNNDLNMIRPPSRATSWTEERTIWLENKRHAYHLIGTVRAHRNTNKENTVQREELQNQKVLKSVGTSTAPKSVVGSLLSFR